MNLDELYDEFLDYLLAEKNASKLTIESYSRDFKILMSFMCQKKIEATLDNFKTPIIRKYIYYMKTTKNYKASTLSRRINSLRSFAHFLLTQEYIDKNPMLPISAPKKPEKLPLYFKESELKRFLEMPMKHSRNNKLRDTVIFQFYAFTGVRRNELISLNMNNIDFKTNTVTVRKGKGNKDRIIPLTEPLITDLWKYINSRLPLPSQNVPLFISGYGNRISVTAIEQLFRRYRKLSGLDNKGYTLHSLRHTYGSLLLQNGADLISIKDLMGHSDLNSTKVYLHTTVKHLKEAANKHPLSNNKIQC